MKNRHSEFDVSNSVQVTNTQSVSNAVCDIYHSCFPASDNSLLKRAFQDFDSLFEGYYKGYNACDTYYHDKQHTLDMTLALMRILQGYMSETNQRYTEREAVLAVITALFHDSGYIRKLHDHKHENGAEYTRIHVSRSAGFLRNYLILIGMGEFAEISANMVHYTGYEVAPENIILPDERYHLLGQMVGTADLIAQMADRCYLEKCRDRLYPEFVLGGLTEIHNENGEMIIVYASPEDLLRKTPGFFETEISYRLNTLFQGLHNHVVSHFDGQNLYMDSIKRNIEHIKRVNQQNQFQGLRRDPPKLSQNNLSASELIKAQHKA